MKSWGTVFALNCAPPNSHTDTLTPAVAACVYRASKEIQLDEVIRVGPDVGELASL